MKVEYYIIQIEKVREILDAISYSERKIKRYEEEADYRQNFFLFHNQDEHDRKIQSMRMALVRLQNYYYKQVKKLSL